MTERKLIYIASPYAGDVEFARAACKYCIEWGHTPIAPHLLYPQLLDDSDPAQRETGLKLGQHVLENCDEIWMCGNETSPGMQAELKAAEHLGIPVRYFGREQILDTPDPVYAIWAKGQPDGPLAGRSGFLCENRKRMYFSSATEAKVRIGDIRNLCLNGCPAAEYECVKYPAENASEHRMHLETIKDLDMIPAFDPDYFEIRSQVYGDTGGGCMVGTVQFYLPELDKSVWVNCNDECATVTSADSIWNEDDSASWERYEDVLLYHTEFKPQIPEDVEPWLPMIKEALRYTVLQEASHYREGQAFHLPVVWLPHLIRELAEPEYLDWLQSEGKSAAIGAQGRILMDEAYPQCGPSPPGMGAMEQR